jgi:hypothetical protein
MLIHQQFHQTNARTLLLLPCHSTKASGQTTAVFVCCQPPGDVLRQLACSPAVPAHSLLMALHVTSLTQQLPAAELWLCFWWHAVCMTPKLQAAQQTQNCKQHNKRPRSTREYIHQLLAPHLRLAAQPPGHILPHQPHLCRHCCCLLGAAGAAAAAAAASKQVAPGCAAAAAACTPGAQAEEVLQEQHNKRQQAWLGSATVCVHTTRH